MLNEKAIQELIKQRKNEERGRSSYWEEMLETFQFKNGEFNSKGLGRKGRNDRSVIHTLAHYLLQTPFRLQGKKFKNFNNILYSSKIIYKRRKNEMVLTGLRQAITLAFLEDQVKISQIDNPIVIIGDGYGFMASLIFQSFRQLKSKIVLINLTQNLLIDAFFIDKSLTDINMALVKDEEQYSQALKNDEIQFILIQADNSKLISKHNIGIAINICSMQEMNSPIIHEYFDHIRKSKNKKTYFYCANRVEKTLPDGTIVNFFKYPWSSQDQILIDELCPWLQKYYTTRPPFYRPYHGQIQHRLILVDKYNTTNA